MYRVSDKKIPLCLDCFSKYSQLHQRRIEENERMMNYLSDQVHASVGLSNFGARFPLRPAPVHVGEIRLNNINVNNSTVGTINTGTIGSIDQSISALIHTGDTKVAESVKVLSEAILNSHDLSKNHQKELIEILSLASREASVPKEERRGSVTVTLLERASQITSIASDVSEICAQHWPILLAMFSSAAG